MIIEIILFINLKLYPQPEKEKEKEEDKSIFNHFPKTKDTRLNLLLN